jgi:hypothetical protein
VSGQLVVVPSWYGTNGGGANFLAKGGGKGSLGLIEVTVNTTVLRSWTSSRLIKRY